jgi:hypothetical protein
MKQKEKEKKPQTDIAVCKRKIITILLNVFTFPE